MFNKKMQNEIKEIKGDIEFLYKLYELLEGQYIYQSCNGISIPKEQRNISVNKVVKLILNKMNLRVKYTPEKIDGFSLVPKEVKNSGD